jgi:membrane protease YdiL (CAAX protease family)
MIDASPWLALGLAALLLVPALVRAPQRGLALVLLAALVLFFSVPALPSLVPGERMLGLRWNWSGTLLALAALLWLAALLVRAGVLRWRDMGFTTVQRPGSAPVVLLVAGVALGLNYVATSFSPFRLTHVPLETWLYQSSVPGLVEETAFRGVLLALADRIHPPRINLAGAPVGWGGALVTLVFVAAHGVSVGTLTGVLPAALLYLWLRARSGSLLAPIVAHNAWNVTVYAAHL